MLPGYLRDIQIEIEQHARDFGLDFFPTIFEVLSYKQMNEVAATWPLSSVGMPELQDMKLDSFIGH